MFLDGIVHNNRFSYILLMSSRGNYLVIIAISGYSTSNFLGEDVPEPVRRAPGSFPAVADKATFDESRDAFSFC